MASGTQGAIDALAKGMGESFLQSAGKKTVLIQAVQRTEAVDDYQKDELLGLLQGKNPFGAYSGQSGEIVGMLKAMKDEMAGDLKGTVRKADTEGSVLACVSQLVRRLVPKNTKNINERNPSIGDKIRPRS